MVDKYNRNICDNDEMIISNSMVGTVIIKTTFCGERRAISSFLFVANK